MIAAKRSSYEAHDVHGPIGSLRGVGNRTRARRDGRRAGAVIAAAPSRRLHRRASGARPRGLRRRVRVVPRRTDERWHRHLRRRSRVPAEVEPPAHHARRPVLHRANDDAEEQGQHAAGGRLRSRHRVSARTERLPAGAQSRLASEDQRKTVRLTAAGRVRAGARFHSRTRRRETVDDRPDQAALDAAATDASAWPYHTQNYRGTRASPRDADHAGQRESPAGRVRVPDGRDVELPDRPARVRRHDVPDDDARDRRGRRDDLQAAVASRLGTARA